MSRIAKALELAEQDVEARSLPEADGIPRSRCVAIGDPQAPLAHFLEILDLNGLLAENGRLVPEIRLVSLGDHFDYGTPEQAAQAGADGLRLLAWLAAHPPDHVTLIVGNHDLSRVGELASIDDATFASARAEATRIYRAKDAGAEAEFAQRYPGFPSVEAVARDFSTFHSSQRSLVVRLLDHRRFKLATAFSDEILLCHAGATLDDLERAQIPHAERSRAPAIAEYLNAVLDAAYSTWGGTGPFKVGSLHTPGNADAGYEGGGMLYHRPCHPACAAPRDFEGDLRRRFDPRRLPLGISQIVGHVTDPKCRELLGEWLVGEAAKVGELRHLVTDGNTVRYARGPLPANARGASYGSILFADAGMLKARADQYALVDVATLGLLVAC